MSLVFLKCVVQQRSLYLLLDAAVYQSIQLLVKYLGKGEDARRGEVSRGFSFH